MIHLAACCMNWLWHLTSSRFFKAPSVESYSSIFIYHFCHNCLQPIQSVSAPQQILHWKVGTSMEAETQASQIWENHEQNVDLISRFCKKSAEKWVWNQNLEYRIQFDIFWFENYPISLSPWTVDHQAWVKTTWIHLDSAGNRSNPRSAQGRQPFQLHLVGQHHQPIITMWSVSSFHPRSLWSYLIPLNA